MDEEEYNYDDYNQDEIEYEDHENDREVPGEYEHPTYSQDAMA